MATLEDLAPNFKRSTLLWPEAATLTSCFDALDQCFNNGSHGLVEHVKSFIETVCTTILIEFDQPIPSQATTNALLAAALKPIGLEGSRSSSNVSKVLSGFNKLAQALSEMRNELGVVAHGKDGFWDPVESDHARAFLFTGDAILSILLNSLEGKQPNLIKTREPHDRFSHLNETINRATQLDAQVVDVEGGSILLLSLAVGGKAEPFEIRVEPSRLLYGVDREIYVEALKTAGDALAQFEYDRAQLPQSVEIDLPELFDATPRPPVVEIEARYRGPLEPLRTELDTFLSARQLAPSAPEAKAELVDSILATLDENMGLDWDRRDALQARLRLACKRVLLAFGVDPTQAVEGSALLVTWLRERKMKGEINKQDQD